MHLCWSGPSLGYSLCDTIIVFDRVRENIPRMPRATISQIVNRPMSEVLTRKSESPSTEHGDDGSSTISAPVPAYSGINPDIEPMRKRPSRAGRLTTPTQPGEVVSAAEFQPMKRDLEIDETLNSEHTSDTGEHDSAPDIAENEGVAPDTRTPKRHAKNRPRRHGRR